MLECIECRARAGSFELGWSAIRVEDPDEGDEPEVVVYCARCLAREFGGSLLSMTPGDSPQPAAPP